MRAWAAVAVLIVLAAVACGGGSDEPSSPVSSSGATGQTTSPTSSSGETTSVSSPTVEPSVAATATPKPTATPEPDALALFNAIKPIAPEQTGNPADDLLGGTPNVLAAEAIAQALAAAGFNLQGITIHVLPVTGTDESLLVLSVHEDQGPSIGDDPDPFISALLDAVDAQPVNVPRMAIHYFGTDDQGPYRITLAAPTQAMRDMASGAISQEAATAQMAYELVR